MKNYLIYIIISVSLVLQYACTETDWSYKEGNFVAFEKTKVSVIEGTSAFAINLVCAQPKRTEAVTITFDYFIDSLNLIEGEDFQILNETNTVTFEPGQGVASIFVQVFSDVLLKELTESLTFTITSVDKPNFNIGMNGPDANNKSCQLDVINACLLTEGIFAGNITGKETPLGQTWWIDYKSDWKWEEIREVEPGVIEYNVTGFWSAQIEYWQNRDGIGPGTYYPVKVTLNLSDPANPKYSIEEKKCATCEYGDYYTKSVNNEPLTLIDVCNKYFELPYTLNSGWATSYIFNVKFQF